MDELLRQAMKLPEENRLQLAEVLLASFAPTPLSDAKRQELDRRIADELANPGVGVPWEEAEAAALARFSR